MQLFKNPFKKKSANSPIFNEVIFGNLGGINKFMNPDPDKTTFVEEGYKKNATVYSIIDLISKSAANIQIKVYTTQDRDALKQYKSLTSGDINDTVMMKANAAKKRGLKPADDSQLAELLRNPNPQQGTSEFITDLIAFKALTGDGFIWGIPRSGQDSETGKLIEMNVLPSHLMEASGGDWDKPVAGWVLNYLNYGKAIDANEVAHIKNFNPDYSTSGSHIFGQSPLQAAYRNLEMNNEAITTGLNYLENQGARGILASDSVGLTQEQAAQLRDKYKSMYGGSGNAGQVMVTNHMFKWLEMGLPLADLALIEQYNLSVKDLANVYKIPSQLLNDSGASTFSNYREAKKYFYLQCIFPELTQLRDELNRWLAPRYGKEYYIDFDFLSVPELQEDMEKVVKQYSLAWWITPNEKRTGMGYDTLDQKGMDDIHILANFLPLSDGVTSREEGGQSQQLLSDFQDYLTKD